MSAAVAVTSALVKYHHHEKSAITSLSSSYSTFTPCPLFTTSSSITCYNLTITKGEIRRRRRRYHQSNKLYQPMPFTPVIMEWQDCTVKLDVDVPTSVAYTCYSDRESIPQWMPFISSVKNFEDNPDLSQWSLKYTAFGRDIQFSWLSRNLQPIPNQKIHWRSLEGLPNRGAVRFFPKGPDACVIELTVSYEVPQLLIPVAAALQPFLQNLLLRGLEEFAMFAKSYSAELPT